MIDASLNMVWQSDVDLTINRLSADKHELKDLDHFHETVDRIEAMHTPDGKHKLTLSALKAWEQRCRTGATQDAPRTTSRHTTEADDQDGPIQNPRTVIHPRVLD